MEDGFHLADGYVGAYRARLNANLRFWDGLDGKADWTYRTATHPLTELVLADYLVIDVTKPYAAHGSYLEIEQAVIAGRPHTTCGGRALNDDVMDTIFTLLINAGKGPVIRDGVDGASRPATETFPYVARRTRIRRISRSTTEWRRERPAIQLELDDIQGGALHPRPSPYVGTHLLLRIDDRAAGRELVRRLMPLVGLGADNTRSGGRGLGHRCLHLPRPQSARRARRVTRQLRTGVSRKAWRHERQSWATSARARPSSGSTPLGTPDVHVALAVLSPDAEHLEAMAERARRAQEELPGVELIWRQECYQLPDRADVVWLQGWDRPAGDRGQRHPADESAASGRSRPASSSSAIRTRPARRRRCPTPSVLGQNGTYIVFRKLHTRVAAYRRYLREKAASREDEALLGAKMVGRWQSGAPLAVTPDQRRSRARCGRHPKQRVPLRR